MRRCIALQGCAFRGDKTTYAHLISSVPGSFGVVTLSEPVNWVAILPQLHRGMMGKQAARVPRSVPTNAAGTCIEIESWVVADTSVK